MYASMDCTGIYMYIVNNKNYTNDVKGWIYYGVCVIDDTNAVDMKGVP